MHKRQTTHYKNLRIQDLIMAVAHLKFLNLVILLAYTTSENLHRGYFTQFLVQHCCDNVNSSKHFGGRGIIPNVLLKFFVFWSHNGDVFPVSFALNILWWIIKNRTSSIILHHLLDLIKMLTTHTIFDVHFEEFWTGSPFLYHRNTLIIEESLHEVKLRTESAKEESHYPQRFERDGPWILLLLLQLLHQYLEPRLPQLSLKLI